MKRNGISTIAVAALFIVGIIIGAGAIYGLGIGPTTTKTQTSVITTGGTTLTVGGTTVTVGGTTFTSTVTGTGPPACLSCLGGLNNSILVGAAQAAGNLSGTFTIGDLQDLSDGLAGQGADDAANAGFAIQDINAWIQTTPLAGKVVFQQSLQDYKEDNTLTATIMNSFLTQGIHITVGPLNSGTAGAMLPFANTNHIVMISPSSTNPAIALPGDYLFRTPPSDNFQGPADAHELLQSGVTHVVILYRNDGYGAGLANATGSTFTSLGGTVVASIPFDISTSNYVPVLGQLDSAYKSAVSSVGAAHVGIYVVSFDEYGQIAVQASNNYPDLLSSTLPWFGTDGQGDESPLVNSTYASIDAQTRLVSSFPGFFNSPLAANVCARQFAARSTLCDGYTLGTYDDMWLAALSILYCAPAAHFTAAQNGPCMQTVLPAIAAGFFGATGVTVLNTAGDRLYASYQFFCIVPGSGSGTAKWIVCGTYDPVAQAVNWIVKPQGIP
jgi:branched-chain amino acid transport system substrate-binding protein